MPVPDDNAAGPTADPPAPSQSATEVSTDPYVIYQLRKPSQRGTAVIPRFVPNTHAPAFSPANYRFARVWPHNDPAFPAASSSAATQHAPRSFEYVGSLGSESSVWSDTASWVSVSSLRTAPSEVRTPLLHQHHPSSITAAEFFNKAQDAVASSSSSNAQRHHPHHHQTGGEKETGRKNTDEEIPSALSESINEDALVDDLLSKASSNKRPGTSNKSSKNHSRNNSDNVDVSPAPEKQVRSRRQSSATRDSGSINNQQQNHASRHSSGTPYDGTARTSRSNHSNGSNNSGTYHEHEHDDDDDQAAGKYSFLPFRTRKRRSLWQWLFCADPQTTARSVTTSVRTVTTTPQITLPATSNINDSSAARNGQQQIQNEKELKIDQLTKNDANRRVTELGNGGAKSNGKTKQRRSPSFEIRRGRPGSQNNGQNNSSHQSRRSMSWNFDPRALFGFDGSKDRETQENTNINRRRSGVRKSNNNIQQQNQQQPQQPQPQQQPQSSAPNGHHGQQQQQQQKTKLQRSSSKKFTREATQAVAERLRNRFSIDRNHIHSNNKSSNNVRREQQTPEVHHQQHVQDHHQRQHQRQQSPYDQPHQQEPHPQPQQQQQLQQPHHPQSTKYATGRTEKEYAHQKNPRNASGNMSNKKERNRSQGRANNDNPANHSDIESKSNRRPKTHNKQQQQQQQHHQPSKRASPSPANLQFNNNINNHDTYEHSEPQDYDGAQVPYDSNGNNQSVQGQSQKSSRINSDLSSRTGASTSNHSFPSVIPKSVGPDDINNMNVMNEEMIINGYTSNLTTSTASPFMNDENYLDNRNASRKAHTSKGNNAYHVHNAAASSQHQHQYHANGDDGGVQNPTVGRKKQSKHINKGEQNYTERYAQPRHVAGSSAGGKKMEPNQHARSNMNNNNTDPLQYMSKGTAHLSHVGIPGTPHQNLTDVDMSTGTARLTSLADQSVQAHKAMHEDQRYQYQHPYQQPHQHAPQQPSKASAIFQNSPLAAAKPYPNGMTRPAEYNDAQQHLYHETARHPGANTQNITVPTDGSSETASPRRFHSDWSDPQATDAEKYSQGASSDNDYRRSSAQSSSPTSSYGHHQQPQNGTRKTKKKHHVDVMGIAEDEPNGLVHAHGAYTGHAHAYQHETQQQQPQLHAPQYVNGRPAGTISNAAYLDNASSNHGSSANSRNTTASARAGTNSGLSAARRRSGSNHGNSKVEKSEKTLMRASELDELPDVPSGRRSAKLKSQPLPQPPTPYDPQQQQQPTYARPNETSHAAYEAAPREARHARNAAKNNSGMERRARKVAADADRFAGRTVTVEERRNSINAKQGHARSSTPRPLHTANQTGAGGTGLEKRIQNVREQLPQVYNRYTEEVVVGTGAGTSPGTGADARWENASASTTGEEGSITSGAHAHVHANMNGHAHGYDSGAGDMEGVSKIRKNRENVVMNANANAVATSHVPQHQQQHQHQGRTRVEQVKGTGSGSGASSRRERDRSKNKYNVVAEGAGEWDDDSVRNANAAMNVPNANAAGNKRYGGVYGKGVVGVVDMNMNMNMDLNMNMKGEEEWENGSASTTGSRRRSSAASRRKRESKVRT